MVARRPAGGAVALSGYLREWETKAKQEDNAITLRVAAGDLIGASPPVSALLQDEPTIESLSLMDFDYSAVGNHEFDEGLAELRRLQFGGCHPATGCFKGAKFQYLAANVIETATGEPAFPPLAVHNVRGIRVGFIGVVLEGAGSILTPVGRAGLDFRNEVTTVNQHVAELKAVGVRAIVVIIHQGGRGTLTGGTITGDIVPIVSAFDAEVDVVVSGHTHQGYWGFVGQKLVTQAFSGGTAFADIDLVLDRETGDVVEKKAQIITTFADVFPGNDPDKHVRRVFEEARAKVAPITDRVVGTAADDITRTENAAGESELGNLIADAQRARTGADIAFTNPGGIRTDILAGPVTFGELFEVQPFSNELVTMTLTGSQIERLLEQQFTLPDRTRVLKPSGITYKWAPLGCAIGIRCAPANRVLPSDVFVGGQLLDLTKSYRVTVNSFLAFGGDSFTVLLEGTDRLFDEKDDLAALVAYIEGLQQPFNAVIEGRILLR